MMRTRKTMLRMTAIAGLAIATLGGCKADPDKVDFDSILSNTTPELKGLAQTDADLRRATAINANQNMRMVWGDITRMFLLDRPSILSPFRAVQTSGQPF